MDSNQKTEGSFSEGIHGVPLGAWKRDGTEDTSSGVFP